MNALKKCFCILGYPGSGKGAQSAYLERMYGLFHIDVGEHLRHISRKDSPFAKDVAYSVHQENILVPDEVVRGVLLQAWKSTIPGGVIIDGAPRRLGQKSIVEDIARQRGAEILGIILLEVDPKKALERIRNRVSCSICSKWYGIGTDVSEDNLICQQCGGVLEHRLDDTAEGIQRRIDIFKRETKPVLSAFHREGKLITVSADGSLEETSALLKESLKSYFM